jgi:hypothetical protein
VGVGVGVGQGHEHIAGVGVGVGTQAPTSSVLFITFSLPPNPNGGSPGVPTLKEMFTFFSLHTFPLGQGIT